MKIIGNRIRRAKQILGKTETSVTLEAREDIKLKGQIAISIILVGVAVYLIGFTGDENLARVAIGWIGIIIGYWVG